jgi:hypothetical protein
MAELQESIDDEDDTGATITSNVPGRTSAIIDPQFGAHFS